MEKLQKKFSLIAGIISIVLCSLVFLSTLLMFFSQVGANVLPSEFTWKLFVVLSGPFYYGFGWRIFPYAGSLFSVFLFVFLLVSGKRFLNSQNKPLSMGTCISSLVFGAIFLVISFVGFGIYSSEDFEEYGLVRVLSIIVFIFTTIVPIAMYIFNLVSGAKANKVEAAAEVAATEENNGENK